jgi:hypothetical protein
LPWGLPSLTQLGGASFLAAHRPATFRHPEPKASARL